MLRIGLVDDEINDLLKVIENLVALDPEAKQVKVFPILLSADTEESIKKQSAWWQQKNIGPALAARNISVFEFPEIEPLGSLDTTNEQECTQILQYLSDQEVDLIISDSSMKEEFAGIKLLETALSDHRWEANKWQCWLMTKWERVAKTIREYRWSGKFDPYARYIDKNKINNSADGVCDPDLERVVRMAINQKEASSKVRGRTRFGDLVGQSPLMNGKGGVYELIEASTRDPTATVLIIGDSGTGKELVAKEIHKHSGKPGAYIDVNCATFPKELIESQLFGHKKGAFTGANADKMGLFELAAKGTLFLDEIGDLPTDLQAKLLRVLQEKSFRRLGDSAQIKVDEVRVIAATNQHLTEMVRDGLFRLELYYRLNVFPIRLSALNERPEDISLLANHFIELFNQHMGKKVSIAEDAMAVLQEHYWVGNVRELENCIHRTFMLIQSDRITGEDISNSIKQGELGEAIETQSSPNWGSTVSAISLDDCASKEAPEIWSIILSGQLRQPLSQLRKKLGEIKAVQIADLADAWARAEFNLAHPPDHECRRLFNMTNNAYKVRVREYRERLKQPHP
jgi:DNA-binding NtrC family response regulator